MHIFGSRVSKVILSGLAVVVVAAGTLFAVGYTQGNNLEAAPIPQFIQHDFIDVSKVMSISKFRSGDGHDFSDSFETCRSMKHYIDQQPSAAGEKYGHANPDFSDPNPATALPIYSPVDGTITDIATETFPLGRQFYIVPDSQPRYIIRLFHVFPAQGISKGMKVTAGQQIGSIGEGQPMDISVELHTSLKVGKVRYVSYFDVMPDSLFAVYQARGVATRDQLQISKAVRDADPLSCNGEEFAKNYSEDANEVRLSGYIPYQPQQQQNGNGQGNQQ